jgi:exopolysaccharide biosynthesis protein
VHDGKGWREWWRAEAAPEAWPGELPALAGRVRWRAAGPGVDWAELELRGEGEARRLRVVLARLDPARVRLRLDTAFAADRRADWTIARAPAKALLAVNAGQFVQTLPWGWVVLDGREVLSPGKGALSSAVVVDSSGAVRLVPAGALDAPGRGRGVAWAFQSYPTLLDGGGRIPAALRDAGAGVDLEHRDARVAVGLLRDGRLLVALTRFDLLGETFGAVPFGLTTPETAALMGALGCTSAVMLDGGISSQLLVRSADGTTRRWRGLRRVPLALVALPR